ncbi:MAG: hypothetical protein VB949_00655, partial [Pseudomonadales bacterium]
GLLEYSVVYTDRSLNHMSQSFQAVMNDISRMLKDVYHAQDAIVVPGSSSFACDLRKWLQIMDAYLGGAHAYHATMPTDSLRTLRDVMAETEAIGFAEVHNQQQKLGDEVRVLLERSGFKSVAATGFQAPGVVVSYTDDDDIQSGRKFLAAGLQIAAGVPLQCDEPDGFRTFRLGLFGLDKLRNVERTVATLNAALSTFG